MGKTWQQLEREARTENSGELLLEAYVPVGAMGKTNE